jgi:hypothetical protein
MTEGTTRQLRLPEELCAAAEAKFGAQFSSLEDLLTFLLRELLADDATKFDEAEKHLVEERLRELGYI